jgi:hypothetical protein
MRSVAEFDKLKMPSVEDKYLAGASLHPPEGSALTMSPIPEKKRSAIG